MIVKVREQEIHLDESKLPLFLSRKWHISDTGYLVWRGVENGKKQTIRFHRLVIEAMPNQIVDHINRNKLDNRRENLRIVTHKENIHNSDRFERIRHYYYDNTKRRWAIDSSKYGIKSLYLESEQAVKDYLAAIDRGEEPKRVFIKRKSLGGAKMTADTRAKIDAMFSQGMKRYQIASVLGLSPSTVGRYLSGVTWSW